jgi:hypothetical protein
VRLPRWLRRRRRVKTTYVIGLDRPGFSCMAEAAAEEMGRRWLAESGESAVIVRYRNVSANLCTIKIEEKP